MTSLCGVNRMVPVPVIVAGQEPGWLREQLNHLVRPLTGEFTFERRCPKGAGPCLVLTDDLRRSGLRQLLLDCVDRTRSDRILVLAWDQPSYGVELLRIPLLRLYFPLVDPAAASAAIAGVTQKARPARFAYDLDPTLPPSLAIALRLVLNRAGDPFGPAPPRNASALALSVPCAPDTLYRSSAAARIDLAKVLATSRIRWLMLRNRGAERNIETVAKHLGFASGRSVRRLVRSEMGISYGELRNASLERLDARLREMINP